MEKLFTLFFCVISLEMYCQPFEIKLSQSPSPLVLRDGNADGFFKEKVSFFMIKCDTVGFENKVFTVNVAGKSCKEFKGDGQVYDVKCDGIDDLRDKTIQILDDQKSTVKGYTFTIRSDIKAIVNPGSNTGSDDVSSNKGPDDISMINEIKRLFPDIITSQYGLLLPENSKNTMYSGRNYIHIFIDQFGNNIFSTIPQGISNRQYVVHIIYKTTLNNREDVVYSVNQLEGEFQDALVFNNAGQLGVINLQAGEVEKWEHKEYLLSTSTTNIKFEVVRTNLKDRNKNEIELQVLKTYTIKMSKVYHGSFDIGLVNSTLENPTYALFTSPADPVQKVVKKTNAGDRGIVTAMATFYTSPVILLENLFGRKNLPNYQLTGRNFLEDHKIYERIYPSVGIGFTDKTFENLFFGLNFEFARSGAIFVGFHYGKVNLFNGGKGFEFEKTPVTEDEFNLHQNNGWRASFAFGVKLDAAIVGNFFRSQSQ